MKVKKFKVTNNFGGGSLQGYITTSYAKLVEIFGMPNSEGDDYKVSTEWTIEDKDGNIASIYDWKSTCLYDDETLTVSQLRKLPSYQWHIGSQNVTTANDLIQFIESKL
jgi:hypothetical protein